MTASASVRVLLLDIGGVLLTEAWDRHARARAAEKFGLDFGNMDERHHILFETHEEGKLGFDEYLDQLVFYRKRPFTRAQFRRFMLAQSKPHLEMISLIKRLKAKNGFRIAVLSNEARELNAYRIRKFKLDGLADLFVSSCYVHLRKPDLDMFRLALDLAQVSPRQAVYIDDTPLFVRVAERMGIRSILHQDYKTTQAKLAAFRWET